MACNPAKFVVPLPAASCHSQYHWPPLLEFLDTTLPNEKSAHLVLAREGRLHQRVECQFSMIILLNLKRTQSQRSTPSLNVHGDTTTSLARKLRLQSLSVSM
jgi:hypothetical protein